jgi:hypothetical protein
MLTFGVMNLINVRLPWGGQLGEVFSLPTTYFSILHIYSTSFVAVSCNLIGFESLQTPCYSGALEAGLATFLL